MRSFVAVVAVGLVALVIVALTQHSSLVYSLGVNPGLHAAQIAPGTPACQGPVRPPSGVSFDRVGFVLSAPSGAPPVRVEVRDADGGRVLASGVLDGGYEDQVAGHPREQVVKVGRVRTDAPLTLCLADEGEQPVVVLGQPGIASPTTTATLGDKAIAADLAFTLRSGDRSLAALLPDIADRAAVFRAGWVTPGVYLVLALLILIAGPIVLARGLARAARADAAQPDSTASATRQ